jgi:hypothetical protein
MVACVDNVCPCTEAGIRAAIAEGGGPFTFECDGPTTLITEAKILIDNDAILDGEGNLTVEGSSTGHSSHSIFQVAVGVTAELHGFAITHGPVSESMWWGAGGILNEGTLAIANTTVSGNHGVAVYCGARPPCTRAGGGVFNAASGVLTLTDSIVSGNYAEQGGGIYNGGTLAVRNSLVSGNRESGAYRGEGGGIYNGGLFFFPEGPSTLTMTSSVVSGNYADSGGGILNHGTAAVTNSTVSGNSAANEGGGILNYGTAAVANSTVSGNVATSGGALFSNHNFFTKMVTLSNSIVDGDCVIAAPLVSNGHNIESPGNTCGFDQPTDQVNVSADDLKLGPLQDNGGPTETHALGEGSVAIDQIPAEDCVDADGEPLTTDQRGFPRDSMCDAGAFEVQP